MRCLRCDEENPNQANFCLGCGARLSQDESPPTSARASPPPGAYTPPHLADRILSSRSALEGERKQVTVLFCDLANSTALAHRLGPDAMHELLNAFFELAAGEIHRYGGTINQFLGDGFMALFGAPLAHEDHVRRAALAALEIQQRLRERRGGALAAPNWDRLALRIGLNTGPVVVGKIGDNLRMDYTAIGDTTNLAARLQQLAEPDTICVSESIQRAAQAYVECEKVGPKRVKGRAEPVMVYRLLGARSRAEVSAGPGHGRVASPLVARDREVAALMACVERLTAGEGGIAGVLGDAGLGKSRLMAEVARAAAERGIVWLEGRGLSFGQTLSYWPFLEILKSWAGITERASEAESWARLEGRVKDLFPDEHEEILPYLATLIGLAVPPDLEHRVKYLDGQAIGRQIFRASRRLFQRLAQGRPLVLVFEDLHWMDQSSTELLQHLFSLVETVPLLLVGVGRPDRQSAAARLRDAARADHGARYTEIVLAPLSAEASASLVSNLVPGRDVLGLLRGRILEKTEGNPFFIEEVVRSLIDSRTLVRDPQGGQWRLTGPPEGIAIPDSVQGAIMARVDRLGEDVKQVLKVASVVGRSFFYRVLRAVTEADQELDRYLEDLQQVELIREKQRLPELEYIFKHALVQEATYESIVLDRRRRLHREVGDCIERLFSGRLDEFYGLLAYHYARSEAWEKAQDYLFKAGDQAGHIAADAEALTHYRHAVEAYGRVFGDRWDRVQRAILERKMGEALFRRGDHAQAAEYLQRALGLLGAPVPATPGAVGFAIARELLRQVAHRFVPGLIGRATPDATERERLSICGVIPWVDYFVDKKRFLLDMLVLLNFSESRDHALGVVFGCMGIGVICDQLAVFGLAGRYHRRALARAEMADDPRAVGHAHLGLCLHESYLGSLDAAIEECRRAATPYRETGELRGWGTVTTMMGIALFLRGDVAAALECSEQLREMGQDSGDPILRAWGLFVQGRVLCQTGELEEAARGLQHAIALHNAMQDYQGMADVNGLLGQCYLRQGRILEAVGVLEESERVITSHGLGGHQITVPRNSLTEAYLAAAEQAEGLERTTWLRKARRASRASLRQGKTFRGGLPHAMRLEGTRAWLEGDRRTARTWWERSRALAEQLGVRYEIAMSGVEMARRGGDSRYLDRARRLLADVGAVPDLVAVQAVAASAPPAKES